MTGLVWERLQNWLWARIQVVYFGNKSQGTGVVGWKIRQARKNRENQSKSAGLNCKFGTTMGHQHPIILGVIQNAPLNCPPEGGKSRGFLYQFRRWFLPQRLSHEVLVLHLQVCACVWMGSGSARVPSCRGRDLRQENTSMQLFAIAKLDQKDSLGRCDVSHRCSLDTTFGQVSFPCFP